MKPSNKIGILIDGYRVGLQRGLHLAKEAGAGGVQFFVGDGELSPENLTASARAKLRGDIGALGLEISALCVWLGGEGYRHREANPGKLELSRRVIELAKELGTDIVTTHIGVIPYDPESEIYGAMAEACNEIRLFAESMDAYMAIETGPTTAYHLKSFLSGIAGKGIAVNYDPANLIMVTGDDPVRGVHELKEYIVHTHAKDGIRYMAVDAREIYTTPGYEFQEGGKIREMVRAREVYRETPLGEGHVRFPEYLRALADIGYKGYLTIEREGGDNPEEDIRQAVRFLQASRRID
jgi:sugar phosphate isomerase/epimerase